LFLPSSTTEFLITKLLITRKDARHSLFDKALDSVDRQRIHKKVMFKIDTSIQTGSALRKFGGMPAIATVVLTMTVAQADDIEGLQLEKPIAVLAEPGAIGSHRPPQFGPRLEEVSSQQQPVELRGPEGLVVSVQTEVGWAAAYPLPVRLGLLPGETYRLKISGLRHRPTDELYPSLRVLSSLGTPRRQKWRFPIEIVIDEDDLIQAFSGNHVQRVVYVSNEPESADVFADRWFDIKPGDSCLSVASTLGQPVAELRIGNRLPFNSLQKYK
jgi:hypothetical protein